MAFLISAKNLDVQGMRFSLRRLLVFLGLAAIAVAAWFYYRPLASEVRFKIIEVNLEAANLLRSTLAAAQNELFDFSSLIVDDATLAKVTQNDGEPCRVLCEGTDLVADWSTQTAIHMYHLNFIGPIVDDQLTVNSLGGGLSGTYGSRYAGIHPQLRIDCEVDYNGPSGNSSAGSANCSYRRRLFYEGDRPAGHLLFLARLTITLRT